MISQINVELYYICKKNMFGIPQADRRIFKRNFLRTAIFSVEYDSIENIKLFKEDITEIFYGFTISPITEGLGIKINFVGNKRIIENTQRNDFLGYELKSQNDDLIINIQTSRTIFRINSGEYKSFDSMTKHLTKLQSLFELLKVENLRNVAVRKLNVLEFERTHKVKEPSQYLLKELINTKLICDLSYFGDEDFVLSNFSHLTLKDNNYVLTLKYGFNSPRGVDDKLKHIVIDINVTSQNKIDKLELIDELSKINQSIFDTFNWIINERFIEVLENEAIEEL